MVSIETIPQSVSGLCNVSAGEDVLFYLTSGDYISNKYEWYVNNILVGSNNTYLLQNPAEGIYNVYVKVLNYQGDYWHGGHFYGGTFTGNFLGGTFHYGTLNGVEFVNQQIKPKPFIVHILNEK